MTQPQTEPQTQSSYRTPDRAHWSTVLRNGTVASVAADGRTVMVDGPDGPLGPVPVLATPVALTVGTRVAMLLDRGAALVIGIVK